MVDYLRNQHIIDDITPTELDDIQKLLITPLRERGVLFKDMNKRVYFQYIKDIKIQIDEYKDSGDMGPVYHSIYRKMEVNWYQPINITNNEIETIIHRGVDNLIAQENQRNKIRCRTRQKK